MRCKGIAGASMVALALAGCGAAAASSTATPNTANPNEITFTPGSDVPAYTPAPTLPPVNHVGDTVDTTTGAKITVVRLAPASSGNEFETPPPGGAFLGAEIKECAGSSVLLVEALEWSVKLADATQIDAGLGVDMTPSPALQSSNLNPDSCTDGWVYFPLPAGAAPKEIHLLKADFYWTL